MPARAWCPLPAATTGPPCAFLWWELPVCPPTAPGATLPPGEDAEPQWAEGLKSGLVAVTLGFPSHSGQDLPGLGTWQSSGH